MNRYIILAVLLLLTGCFDTSYSAPKTEKGVIEDVIYSPSHTSSGSGFAINSKGGISPVFTSDTTPEKFVVVFRCEHGKFIMDSDSNERAKGIWSKVKRGDAVVITYREVYRKYGTHPTELYKLETMDVAVANSVDVEASK